MTGRSLSLLAALCAGLALAACGNSETDAADQAMTGETDTTVSATGEAAGEAAAGSDTEAGTQTASPTSPGTREMTLGSPDAPVTLVEYASVTCPACAQFHAFVFPELREKYIDTGKVQLVFREFPTQPAQLAYLGSALARCAADQKGAEAYFAMLKTLFVNQEKWISENYAPELLGYAAQAGLSEEGFRTCVRRDEIINAINDNVELGNTVDDVSGTPTFILQGEKMEGYSSYADFLGMIDEALVAAGAEPPADDAEPAAPVQDVAPGQTPADPTPADPTPADQDTGEE